MTKIPIRQSPPWTSEAPVPPASFGILPHDASLVLLFEVHALSWAMTDSTYLYRFHQYGKLPWSKHVAEFVTDLPQFILSLRLNALQFFFVISPESWLFLLIVLLNSCHLNISKSPPSWSFQGGGGGGKLFKKIT
jgi:hypothetical protein